MFSTPSLLMTTMVLMMVLAASLARGDKILCANLRTLKTLNVGLLRGQWEVEEMVLFSGGRPTTEAPLPHGGGTAKCVSAEVTSANASEVHLKMTFHGLENQKIVPPATFLVSGDEAGRWSLQASDLRVHNSEILVLAANPDRYLVLLMCAPEGNDLSSSLPLRLSLMTRRDSPRPLSQDELLKVREGVAKTLGLSTLQPIKLSKNCP